MEIRQTGIEGLVEFVPTVFNDERGWFFEFYKETTLQAFGIDMKFPQGLNFDPDPKHKAIAEKSKKRFDEWLKQKIANGGKATSSVVDTHGAAAQVVEGAKAGAEGAADVPKSQEVPQ